MSPWRASRPPARARAAARRDGRRPRLWLLSLLTAIPSAAAALGCGGAADAGRTSAGPSADRPAAHRWSYDAHVGDEAITARVCMIEGYAHALRFDHGLEAVGSVSMLERDPSASGDGATGDGAASQSASEASIERRDGALFVELDPGHCVAYEVSLEALDQRGLLERDGDSLLLRSDGWMAEPEPRTADASASLSLSIAGGGDVVAPYPVGERGYELDASTFSFSGAVMIRPSWQSAQVLGGTLTEVGAAGSLSRAAIARWLTEEAQAVSLLYETLPVRQLTVAAMAGRGGDGPVAFGTAMRGGGPLLIYRVSPDATLEQLLSDDWVGIHEMVHLGLPYVRPDDRWLSEGIATYYQEVLRARSGLQTERDAWQAMVDGFARARSDDGRTLRQAAAVVDDTREYARVYWGGAAVVLVTDVQLRRQRRGSFDEIVRALSRCCAWPPRRWSSRELVPLMDGLVGGTELSAVVSRMVDGEQLVALDSVLEYLGVEVEAGGRVRLVEAPGDKLREQITGLREPVEEEPPPPGRLGGLEAEAAATADTERRERAERERAERREAVRRRLERLRSSPTARSSTERPAAGAAGGGRRFALAFQ